MKKILLTALCGLFALSACAGRRTPLTVIVQVTDPQMGFYTDNRDMTYETENLTRIVEAVNRLHPDAVVFTGDYVHDPESEAQWSEFLRIAARIDPRIRTAHIPGNHDLRIENGAVDITPYEKHIGKDHFRIRVKGALLTGINSERLKVEDSDLAAAEEEIRRMESSLARKRKGEVSILFTHHPFFLQRIDEPEGYSTLAPEIRRRCFADFERLRVDAVFAGHLHDNAEAEYRGIPMIVTSAVGRQLGAAKPGVRIIWIREGSIRHRYFPIEEIPSDRKCLE